MTFIFFKLYQNLYHYQIIPKFGKYVGIRNFLLANWQQIKP